MTTRERYLTVVFWDIKNFSCLCDILKKHSALLVPFLREFFEIANQVICQQGSILNEFLGDGLMAIFEMQGRDHNCANDAICAVQAAIELRKRFNCLETKWVNIWSHYVPQNISIGLKCGINSGYARVDNIGTKKRAQFTAIGSTINIASRLADMSDSSQIIITSATKLKIANQFEAKKLGVVNDLKNIPGSFEIFNVIKKKGKDAN